MQFREVMRPPLWVLAFIYFMFLSLVVAIWAALGNASALAALIFTTVLIFIIAFSARSHISITETELVIDKAHIEKKYCGEVTVLDRDAMRLLRTRDADPAAFLAIKFWISTGVKIAIIDDRDPTPYWLVSSKKAEEFKRTLCR
ncbi:MAG: DUF3093 domain-containing protein [Actinobacteria bacterium]|nr:DUF3093 domain-containing protein [Actinomycetota bacterium]